jgi:hypothetical protein
VNRQLAAIASCVVVATGLVAPAHAWSGETLTPAQMRAALSPATLRTPGVRCSLGQAYAGNDDARAAIYLASCQAPEVGDVDRERGASLAAATERRLLASGHVRIAINASRPGVWVTLDGSPVDEVQAPAEIWQLPGVHRYTAMVAGRVLASVLDVQPGSPASVLFELPAEAPPETATVDFSEGDEPAEGGVAGPPPDRPHESLLPEKMRRGVETTRAPSDDGPLRDQPIALRRRTVDLWLGARAGLGVVFAGGAAFAPSVGVLVEPAVPRPWHLEASADLLAPLERADTVAVGLALGRDVRAAGALVPSLRGGVRGAFAPGDDTRPWAEATLAARVEFRRRQLGAELLASGALTSPGGGVHPVALVLGMTARLPVL